MEYIYSIITGVISGLIASYFFVKFYIRKNVPKIDISENISYVPYKERDVYMFKL